MKKLFVASSAIGLFLALAACAPQPGSGQVAIHSTAPPGKSPIVFQKEKDLCTRISNGNPALFVNCMQQRGNTEEVRGPGGVTRTFAAAAPPTQAVPMAAVAPRPAPSPPSEESLKYTRLLDRSVAEDSKSWAINEYRSGSMRDVTIERDNGSQKLVKGFYSYSSGKSGWVEAQFVGDRVSCLHYWDRVDCRPMGEGAGKQLDEAAKRARENPQPPKPAETSSGGSLFCNKALGTSPWNIMSPCNY